MPERLASLPATLPVHVREIRSRVCRCGLSTAVYMSFGFGQHSPPRTPFSRRIWSCGATWSDMKRTCATCHEYSWHAPFVSSNSMVVVTNGGHSRSGRHSSPRAPFCTVLGADWGWRLECSSRVRARCRAEAVYLVQFRGRGDKPWPFCAWLPFSFLRTALPFSLSCPALQQVRASCH